MAVKNSDNKFRKAAFDADAAPKHESIYSSQYF